MAVCVEADGSVHLRSLAELTLGALSWDVEQDVPQLGTGRFYAEFTEDSGGRKGRLTLSDYVSQIGRGGTSNCIIVEEPPEEETPEEEQA